MRPFSFDEDLRRLLAGNLGAHDRLGLPLEGRLHAAVAVVVLDSDPVLHGGDPNP